MMKEQTKIINIQEIMQLTHESFTTAKVQEMDIDKYTKNTTIF